MPDQVRHDERGMANRGRALSMIVSGTARAAATGFCRRIVVAENRFPLFRTML
jgi:hypothetical protein